MRADARVRVERTPEGSRGVELRSDPPFTFRQAGPVLCWVGTAAGPVGGDDLHLDVEVGEGATLELGSVAASIVHPGATGLPSRGTTAVRVHPEGTLRWAPQPVVLVRGCDHTALTTVDLAAGATLLWRDEVVLGRYEEESGSIRQRLVVDLDGVPLLRTELAVGPRWPGSTGPAGTAGARAVGTLLLVGGAAGPGIEPPVGVRLAVQPLTGDAGAVLVTAVADRPGALSVAFDAFVSRWGLPCNPQRDQKAVTASGG